MSVAACDHAWGAFLSVMVLPAWKGAVSNQLHYGLTKLEQGEAYAASKQYIVCSACG